MEPCDANCELSQWEPWSPCSVTCFDTIRYNFPKRSRKRKVISEAIGKGLCPYVEEEKHECPDIPKCPVNGEWSAWSKSQDCDKLCGEGTEVFTRYSLSIKP